MTGKSEGELIEWDDVRGFGFVRPDGEGARVFIHIKSIRRIVNRPRPGDRLRFTIGPGRDGRRAALDAEIIGANPVDVRSSERGRPPPVVPSASPADAIRPGLALAIIALVVADVGLTGSATGLALLYLGAGVVSIAAYWLDKHAAETAAWRIPEKTLHLIDLGFGIVGGLVAQQLLRHKTSKPAFATVTYGIAALHLAGLLALAAGLTASWG